MHTFNISKRLEYSGLADEWGVASGGFRHVAGFEQPLSSGAYYYYVKNDVRNIKF